MIQKNAKIVVAGAGSVGCYVGGCLALAGRTVTLLARPRIEEAARRGGLRVSDLDGRDRLAQAAAFRIAADPAAALADAAVVLVTVKSGATGEMAKLVAAHAPAGAVVVSFQNGVDNVEALRAALGQRRVIAGMVPFNVVQHPAEGASPFHVHKASEGIALVGQGVEGLAELLDVEGFPVSTHADMAAVQWGKLLFNLNNALVALSDLPLAQELADRRWRLLLAGQMREALAAMKAGGIVPARVAGPPPVLLPAILALPDWLFRRLARRMLAIDPQARSSMWEDLKRGRPTEIDALQGTVLRLAESAGTPAPLTKRVTERIRAAERHGAGPPGLDAGAV